MKAKKHKFRWTERELSCITRSATAGEAFQCIQAFAPDRTYNAVYVMFHRVNNLGYMPETWSGKREEIELAKRMKIWKEEQKQKEDSKLVNILDDLADAPKESAEWTIPVHDMTIKVQGETCTVEFPLSELARVMVGLYGMPRKVRKDGDMVVHVNPPDPGLKAKRVEERTRTAHQWL